MQYQFENHFQADEIEQLAREKQFVQRRSKLDGITFLSLIVFNINSLHKESLNDLTVDLAQNYKVDITKQGLQDRFNTCAVDFLTAALENLLNKQLADKECYKFMGCPLFDPFLSSMERNIANPTPVQ